MQVENQDQKKKRFRGVPEVEIRTAMSAYETVAVKVSRQNPKGRISTVISYMVMTLEQLLSIEAYMQAHAGGGDYLVDVKNPDGTDLDAIPHFSFNMEGFPKPMMAGAAPAAPQNSVSAGIGGSFPTIPAQGGAPNMFPIEPPPWPSTHTWFGGYPVDQQWQMFRQYFPQHPQNQMLQQQMPQGGVQIPPGASMPSDAMAMHFSRQQAMETNTLKAELARANERMERLIQDAAESKRQADEARARAERESQEARHRAEMSTLTASIESLKMQLQAPRAPERSSMVEMAAAIAPFVPVFTAMVSKDDGHARMMEIMLASNQKKGPSEAGEILKVALPVIAPIILGLIQSRSPEAQMEVLQQATQGQMAMIKMMADFVQAQNAGEDAPWWHPVLGAALQAVQGVGAAIAQGQQAPQQQKQLPSGSSIVQPPQQVRTVPAAGAPYMTENDPLFQYDAEAARFVKMIYDVNAPEIEDFKSPEWKTILFNMHMKLEPDELVTVFVDHLEHLRTFNIIPRVLAGVFEDPAKVLGDLLAKLPIGQLDKDYTSRLLIATTNEVHNRERERIKSSQEPNEDEDDESSDGPALVTPTPTPTSAAAEEEDDGYGSNGAGDEGDDADDDTDDDEQVGHA